MVIAVPNTRSADKIGKSIGRVKAGRYFVVFQEWVEFAENNNWHTARFEIKAAEGDDAEDLIGSTFSELFWAKGYNDKDTSWSDKLNWFAIVLGLTTHEKCEEAKKSGVPQELDFEQGIGRHLHVAVFMKKRKKDPERTDPAIAKEGYALYVPGDERCEGWPVDLKALEYDSKEREQAAKTDDLVGSLGDF